MKTNEINKLDEPSKLDYILNEFIDEVNEKPYNSLVEYKKKRKKAKQAIIELIEGEIIGENDKVKIKIVGQSAFIEQSIPFMRNVLRTEQRQKLAKLKEL